MVAMLISIAIAAIWMSAALPSWRQQAIREKEAELIFRGEQYARAVYLYRMKNNGALPQSIDQLVDQRYLRKKYLDPITGKEFLPNGGLAPVTAGRQGGPAPFAPAGINGVRSTSNEESIKIYTNQSIYSQWAFDWPAAAQKAGLFGLGLTPEGGRRGGQPGREGRGGQEGGFGRMPRPPGGGGELMPITPGRGIRSGLPLQPEPPPPPPPGGRRGF